MRLAVVGGGSTYTPELMDGIVTGKAGLPVTEIVLVDPDEHRLAVVGGVCQRMLAHAGHPARLRTTRNLDAGVAGATAVLLQLRVGGQRARLSDETFPLACGCLGQETTGAGGLAKALRTVPVVLDIASRVRTAAADAWIVNFTNPVGIVTGALLGEGHRAVGLCNVAITFKLWTAALFGVPPERVDLDHVGLNHLTWTRSARVDGEERITDLLGTHAERVAEHIGVPTDLLRRIGAVPSYYLKYFYRHDAVVADLLKEPPRAQTVAELERELLRLYADSSTVRKPELLSKRGGAHYSTGALELVRALTSGRPAEDHVVDVRNRGVLPFLPDDAVIEVMSSVDDRGAVPHPVPAMEPALAGLTSHVAGYELLALDAAVRGGRNRVAAALLAHPLVGQWDVAERLADELVSRNREFLAWA
ncbi:family 4 glycosyl hydrolase, alpha-galactosidase/6-phospho-beta-glucosidase [Saccharomonospora marina XMU15]|uniref:Family 4 glycosyl hydrolase, alpha-galactosidase/6-phospho-beta-glucosidase n=1 Tax=Saccharomonospora marina XMU15 TaxID=882083 RepID=H5X7T2_9PSEU|nr:6-phospho-beta-glucosidase [Saccharomonospora marina]EHR52432.1 family 4 glycosyl hydrolase, alpha-galactosidase/6-phospho-beta-glucosidase [Saccharomonospora marina XMU15]